MNDPSIHKCGSIEPSLVLIHENDIIAKATDENKLPFTCLPGESARKVTRTQDYYILATNFRLTACFYDTFFNIPLYLIDYVEIREIVTLFIYCKDAKTFRISFECPEVCTEWYYQLLSLTAAPEQLNQLFAFTYFESLTAELGNISISTNSTRDFSEVYDLVAEKNRMGFDTSQIWKVTEINTQFEVCASYPKLHLVPSWVPDEDIRASANFRSMGRFPSVVWRNKRNGAVLARSSQPELGLLGWRSTEDELLLTAIAQASSLDKGGSGCGMTASATKLSYAGKPLLIIDARSYTAAVANRAKGGGCECHEYYPHCEVQFMGMANIHGIRKSMQNLRNLCSQGLEQSNWYSMLESTKWLHYLSALLRSSVLLVEALDKGEQSVLVHCSDGWDRTTQLVAMAELLMDPYYRSMQGFQVLIEREWLEFGHKFGDRCGHSTDRDTNERCPVFLQWLDCVHQVMKQFPTAFEFNEGYVVKLVQHAYSCLFGTFFCNTLKEKLEAKLRTKTPSVWSLMNVSRREFKNFLYSPTDKVLYPQHHVRCLVVWERMYLSTNTSLHDTSTFFDDACNCLSDSGRFTYESSVASSAFTTRDVKGVSGINHSLLSSESTSEKYESEPVGPQTSEESSTESFDRDDGERDSEGSENTPGSDESDLNDASNKDGLSLNSSTTSSTQTVLAREDYQENIEETPKVIIEAVSSATEGVETQECFVSTGNHCSKSQATFTKRPQLPQKYSTKVRELDTVSNVLRTKSYSDAMSVSAVEIGQGSKNITTPISINPENISNFLYLDGLCKPCNSVEHRLYMLDLSHRSDISKLQKKVEYERQQRLLSLQQNSDAVPMMKELDTPDDLVSLPDSLNGERTSVSSISNEEGWEQVQYEDVQPTRWFPDHIAVHCANCDTQFGIFVRKHHCRKCGNVFCYACSKRCAPVPKEQHFDEVRVCVNCFESLNGFGL